MDIWTSTRESVLDPWGAPTNVTELNTGFVDQNAHIAADRETLYFTSNRAGITPRCSGARRTRSRQQS
jgi:hypothetical protein